MKSARVLFTRMGGLTASAAVRAWMGTLEYKAALYDPVVDPAHPQFRGQKIYLLWHEYIPFPLFLRGNCHLTMLLSRHKDADLLYHMACFLGFDFVRGSTARGGITALRELLRKSQTTSLTMTPDGPRGPRRVLALGPIYLSSRLGLPLVLMGFGYDRPWRTPTWDHFAIPRPFSRARAVLSPAIQIPANLDRAGLEERRVQIERLLNRLTCEAEAWAEAGTRKLGEIPVHRQRAARRLRVDRKHDLAGPSGRGAAEQVFADELEKRSSEAS